MLTRLRARAIGGATNLVRLLDARRERAGLRETVDHLIDERDDARRERDEYARLVATREVEIDELLRLRREIEAMETTGAVLAAQEAQFDQLSGTIEVSRRAAMQIGFRHRKELADARTEAARLCAEVERLTTERDEHAQGVSVLACRIDRVQQERDAAKAECERLRAELERARRENHSIQCHLDRATTDAETVRHALAKVAMERDARIPTDIDGAQAWLRARGWWFEREDSSPTSEPWSAYRDTAAQPVLVADTYWWAVLQALGEELSEAWDSAPSPEDDA